MQESISLAFAIPAYLILLLFLGWKAKQQRQDSSLKEFYLAGKGLGTYILLFTLYATQYSSNTMMVVPAEVVNQGYGMILVLGYMTAIVICYLTFAPGLYALSRVQTFITPGDFIDQRFGSPRLSLLVNMVFIVVSLNFLLAQLMAMGYITESISNGVIPYWLGVTGLALIVIIYETIGGMRAVAWTDLIQGGMLLIGLIGIFMVVGPTPAKLEDVTGWLLQHDPARAQVPSATFRVYWASTVLMVGLGASVYPQAIQRLYAARSLKTLKLSLSWMVFMPLFTVLILFLLGVVSIPYYPELNGTSTDAVLPEMLHLWGQQSIVAQVLVTLVILGLIAAIMSTADSVLLTMSSILAKDILGKGRLKNQPEARLTSYGKVISILVMIVATLWAMNPTITLWGLIELKMQLLVQVVPVFILGVHSHFKARSMYFGMVAGLAFAIITFMIGQSTIGGVQSGLIGLALNLLIAAITELGAGYRVPGARS